MEFPLIYLNSTSMNNNLICLKTLSPQHTDLQQPSISFHNQWALTVFILLCPPSLPLKFRLPPCSGAASVHAALCTGITQQLDLWRRFPISRSFALAGRVCCLQEETFLGMRQKSTQLWYWVAKKRWGYNPESQGMEKPSLICPLRCSAEARGTKLAK